MDGFLSAQRGRCIAAHLDDRVRPGTEGLASLRDMRPIEAAACQTLYCRGQLHVGRARRTWHGTVAGAIAAGEALDVRPRSLREQQSPGARDRIKVGTRRERLDGAGLGMRGRKRTAGANTAVTPPAALRELVRLFESRSRRVDSSRTRRRRRRRRYVSVR